MRITLKPVNGGTTSNQAAASKVSGQSFLDMLTQASSSAANMSAVAGAAQKDSSSETSDHGNEDQTPGQPIAASEKGAGDAQESFTAGSSIGNFAAVIGSAQNQDAVPTQAASTTGRPSSAHSQPKSKASQPAEEQVTVSIQQIGDQGAAQQLAVSMPTVPLPEVSMGGSVQCEATSPKDSAELPVFPTFQWSNANPTARTGSDGADTSQSAVSPSASPAVSQSENSIGRSMQSEAAALKDSVQLQAPSTVQWSITKPAAQTGSDEANSSQNAVPPSGSTAVSLSEVSVGRSMQFEAASPKVSADLPTFSANLSSNANSAAQTGSDEANTSQSAVPSSASSAVSQSEVSVGRSMQFEAASPKVSADLPTFSPVLRSNAKSTAQTGSDSADASQSPALSSAVSLSEVSVGRSTRYEAVSPKVSADLPTFSPVRWSNTNSPAQTGSDGADASQSPTPSSAVSLSEVSSTRSTRYEAVSPKVSLDLPTFSPVPWSNTNSSAQTGSDGEDASQSSVPPSASPATTDLSKAIAAGLIEPSTLGEGSTFAQSMILSNGGGTGTLSDKTSQFKSSGSTLTVNSSDTSSPKASSARDSISADHSAQSGNPLPQHAPGDSSAATPLPIKPLETTVTQTVPASSHTTFVSSGQPHATSSATDVPIRAQDPADAAAEHLERAGSTAAAGVSTARLIQTMSESEMRVGMHSAEFGDISIRTSVSQQQLTAQISVDHSELGSAISAHLPSLQSKLGSEFGLHASIDVNQLGGSVTGGNGQSSPHQNHKMTTQSVLLDSSMLQADRDPMTLPGESSRGFETRHQGLTRNELAKGNSDEHPRYQPDNYSSDGWPKREQTGGCRELERFVEQLLLKLVILEP